MEIVFTEGDSDRVSSILYTVHHFSIRRTILKVRVICYITPGNQKKKKRFLALSYVNCGKMNENIILKNFMPIIRSEICNTINCAGPVRSLSN